jgi:hypothetical protein
MAGEVTKRLAVAATEPKPRRHLLGCLGFWGWAVSGGLIVFSALSMASIGLFVAPLALVASVVMVRRSPSWPEPLGLVLGCGAIVFVIGLLNFSDGGLDPLPWLVSGALLTAAAVLGYGAARAR